MKITLFQICVLMSIAQTLIGEKKYKFIDLSVEAHNCLEMRKLVDELPFFNSYTFDLLKYPVKKYFSSKISFRNIIIDKIVKDKLKVDFSELKKEVSLGKTYEAYMMSLEKNVFIFKSFDFIIGDLVRQKRISMGELRKMKQIYLNLYNKARQNKDKPIEEFDDIFSPDEENVVKKYSFNHIESLSELVHLRNFTKIIYILKYVDYKGVGQNVFHDFIIKRRALIFKTYILDKKMSWIKNRIKVNQEKLAKLRNKIVTFSRKNLIMVSGIFLDYASLTRLSRRVVPKKLLGSKTISKIVSVTGYRKRDAFLIDEMIRFYQNFVELQPSLNLFAEISQDMPNLLNFLIAVLPDEAEEVRNNYLNSILLFKTVVALEELRDKLELYLIGMKDRQVRFEEVTIPFFKIPDGKINDDVLEVIFQPIMIQRTQQSNSESNSDSSSESNPESSTESTIPKTLTIQEELNMRRAYLDFQMTEGDSQQPTHIRVVDHIQQLETLIETKENQRKELVEDLKLKFNTKMKQVKRKLFQNGEYANYVNNLYMFFYTIKRLAKYNKAQFEYKNKYTRYSALQQNLKIDYLLDFTITQESIEDLEEKIEFFHSSTQGTFPLNHLKDVLPGVAQSICRISSHYIFELRNNNEIYQTHIANMKEKLNIARGFIYLEQIVDQAFGKVFAGVQQIFSSHDPAIQVLRGQDKHWENYSQGYQCFTKSDLSHYFFQLMKTNVILDERIFLKSFFRELHNDQYIKEIVYMNYSTITSNDYLQNLIVKNTSSKAFLKDSKKLTMQISEKFIDHYSLVMNMYKDYMEFSLREKKEPVTNVTFMKKIKLYFMRFIRNIKNAIIEYGNKEKSFKENMFDLIVYYTVYYITGFIPIIGSLPLIRSIITYLVYGLVAMFLKMVMKTFSLGFKFMKTVIRESTSLWSKQVSKKHIALNYEYYFEVIYNNDGKIMNISEMIDMMEKEESSETQQKGQKIGGGIDLDATNHYYNIYKDKFKEILQMPHKELQNYDTNNIFDVTMEDMENGFIQDKAESQISTFDFVNGPTSQTTTQTTTETSTDTSTESTETQDKEKILIELDIIEKMFVKKASDKTSLINIVDSGNLFTENSISMTENELREMKSILSEDQKKTIETYFGGLKKQINEVRRSMSLEKHSSLIPEDESDTSNSSQTELQSSSPDTSSTQESSDDSSVQVQQQSGLPTATESDDLIPTTSLAKRKTNFLMSLTHDPSSEEFSFGEHKRVLNTRSIDSVSPEDQSQYSRIQVSKEDLPKLKILNARLIEIERILSVDKEKSLTIFTSIQNGDDEEKLVKDVNFSVFVGEFIRYNQQMAILDDSMEIQHTEDDGGDEHQNIDVSSGTTEQTRQKERKLAEKKEHRLRIKVLNEQHREIKERKLNAEVTNKQNLGSFYDEADSQDSKVLKAIDQLHFNHVQFIKKTIKMAQMKNKEFHSLDIDDQNVKIKMALDMVLNSSETRLSSASFFEKKNLENQEDERVLQNMFIESETPIIESQTKSVVSFNEIADRCFSSEDREEVANYDFLIILTIFGDGNKIPSEERYITDKEQAREMIEYFLLNDFKAQPDMVQLSTDEPDIRVVDSDTQDDGGNSFGDQEVDFGNTVPKKKVDLSTIEVVPSKVGFNLPTDHDSTSATDSSGSGTQITKSVTFVDEDSDGQEPLATVLGDDPIKSIKPRNPNGVAGEMLLSKPNHPRMQLSIFYSPPDTTKIEKIIYNKFANEPVLNMEDQQQDTSQTEDTSQIDPEQVIPIQSQSDTSTEPVQIDTEETDETRANKVYITGVDGESIYYEIPDSDESSKQIPSNVSFKDVKGDEYASSKIKIFDETYFDDKKKKQINMEGLVPNLPDTILLVDNKGYEKFRTQNGTVQIVPLNIERGTLDMSIYFKKVPIIEPTVLGDLIRPQIKGYEEMEFIYAGTRDELNKSSLMIRTNLNNALFMSMGQMKRSYSTRRGVVQLGLGNLSTDHRKRQLKKVKAVRNILI